MVLAYALPEPVVAGTVIIPEPAANGGGTSDVLRFTDSTGILSGVTDAGHDDNDLLLRFACPVTRRQPAWRTLGFP